MAGEKKILMLTVTEECNLNCIYCYEKYKTSKIMDIDTAKSVIEKHFRANDSFEEMQIEFFGGEPFMQFDLIQAICEWVWGKTWGKRYSFFATTNGTLIHGRIQDWIDKNRNHFYLALSLDGLPEMHNYNRSGSFDLIDIHFFSSTWPEQPVKMTVSQYSLPSLAQGVEHLHDMGFKVDCNLAQGIDWSDAENISLLADQLDKLVSYYINHPEIEPSSFVAMHIEAVLQKPLPVNKWCGVGTHIFAVDTNGQEYPCHMFQPLSSGKKALTSSQISFTDFDALQDKRCDDCILLPICPTCYGSNYLISGDPAIRDTSLCTLIKLRALACSKMQAMKLKSTSAADIVNYDEASQKLQMIQAIREIQTTINPMVKI